MCRSCRPCRCKIFATRDWKLVSIWYLMLTPRVDFRCPLPVNMPRRLCFLPGMLYKTSRWSNLCPFLLLLCTYRYAQTYLFFRMFVLSGTYKLAGNTLPVRTYIRAYYPFLCLAGHYSLSAVLVNSSLLCIPTCECLKESNKNLPCTD